MKITTVALLGLFIYTTLTDAAVLCTTKEVEKRKYPPLSNMQKYMYTVTRTKAHAFVLCYFYRIATGTVSLNYNFIFTCVATFYVAAWTSFSHGVEYTMKKSVLL